MWQRIQTLFLFLAGIASAIEFLICENYIILAIAIGIISVLSFVTIFLYKKRKLQIKFCIIIIVLLICLFAFLTIFLFVFSYLDVKVFFNLEPIEIAGLFLPVVSLIFIIFAKKFIKKDEKKVRSWERIR